MIISHTGVTVSVVNSPAIQVALEKPAQTGQESAKLYYLAKGGHLVRFLVLLETLVHQN